MQSTLDKFSQIDSSTYGTNPPYPQDCSTCIVDHRFVVSCGERKVKCGLLGLFPIPVSCKRWFPEDPDLYIPPLPSNYEIPKKYRGT